MVATVGSISIDLSTNVSRFAAGFKGAATTVERESGRMARSIRGVESSMVAFTRGLAGGLAGGLGAREVIRFADAWTEAGNKIAAAGQVAGREGRSLSALNDIATETRTGIGETADLYAKLLRATAGVAKSEGEVAKATELVNKAFKAGGAAASEQAAGILQLGQALGSGFLQGDELRSLRENAPLVAQAIATEFGTTIAGLKELGANGELEAGRVFKAILKAEKSINAAFATTQTTISDGYTLIANATQELVGTFDKATGASGAFAGGMGILAEKIQATADAIQRLKDNEDAGSSVGLLENLLEYDFFTPRALIEDLMNTVGMIGGIFRDEALETSQSVAQMEADIASLQFKIGDLILSGSDMDLLQAQKFADDVDFMKAKLAELQSASNMQRAAFAQQYRELENRTMDAYNASRLPAPSRTAGSTGTRTEVDGIGVTRYGAPASDAIGDVEDQIIRGNEYQQEGNLALQQIISEVQAGTRSINDLPQSISVNYNSIADAVRIGIISGMPRDESRQQYSISTGSGTAALERQIEELRLVQATVGSLASEQISQQIAQLELQLFRTQNPIGRGIGGGPYSGSVSYAGAFAEGGSFTVPGNQTGDTTNLLLRANGGEEVEVRPAGQSGASIVINYTPDAFEPFSTSEQRARKIGDIITRATRRR